ncbi:anthocyanidin 3-O-glucosyltransferase 5-like [Dorcoceras hygrometricum]|uniref:Anthocyanidin 3-O-glucosyltransferase 5-like n=1 Tax=Dorcoceras hygrometricum TaxID=472368 RepID=A0A2Z7BM63_9LAMI|nr:anthocyanidin 3-O-glucosyltransferase 5-like [Dorcoceras hygrometricum]
MATGSFKNLHIVILSSPGVGHLTPVILLANHLAAQHNIKTTILKVTAGGAPPESSLMKLPTEEGLVETVELPLADISHLMNVTNVIQTPQTAKLPQQSGLPKQLNSPNG